MNWEQLVKPVPSHSSAHPFLFRNKGVLFPCYREGTYRFSDFFGGNVRKYLLQLLFLEFLQLEILNISKYYMLGYPEPHQMDTGFCEHIKVVYRVLSSTFTGSPISWGTCKQLYRTSGVLAVNNMMWMMYCFKAGGKSKWFYW